MSEQMQNYTVPFGFEGVHNTDVLVITCMDFRFWKSITDFIEKGLGISSYDFPILPGVSKAINESSENDLPMQCVKIGCNLHHVKKIVLIDHADCGAYGGSSQFNGDIDAEECFHADALRRAVKKITEQYPHVEVVPTYAKLIDNCKKIEFVMIDE